MIRNILDSCKFQDSQALIMLFGGRVVCLFWSFVQMSLFFADYLSSFHCSFNSKSFVMKLEIDDFDQIACEVN